VRHLVLPLVAVLVAGCASTQRVDPVPDSAWRAAEGSPRTSYPTTSSAPITTPRRDPARSSSSLTLTKEQVLAIATSQDPAEAIAEVDRHPFAFKLTNENLGWFEDRLAPPEFLDYLKKRAAVDWDRLAQAPSTDQPQQLEGGFGYVTPSTPSSDTLPPTTTVYTDSPPPQVTVVYENDSPYYYHDGAIWVWGGFYGARHWYRNGYSYYYNQPYYRPNYYTGGQPVAGLYVAPGVNATVRTAAPQGVVVRGSVRSGGFHAGGHGTGHGGHH
jgi:hypothetical protein